MNKYKSFILTGLFVMGFASCNTDDLERDIDALEDRIENFEAQVQKLNEEMNIIRILLDGNKTITNYTVDGDVYTLTLSNGETITLTHGKQGGSYPGIYIGDNGNWFIDGIDSGNRAEAADGDDVSVTPQFKVENGNWWVSYDDGVTYTDLGKPAIGTPDQSVGESPVTNFKVEGNKFVFTVGGEVYEIPVVEGLICQIMNNEGSRSIAQGKTLDINVRVSLKTGDLVRAIAPVEWNTSVSDYSALTGEQELTITVTAPNTPSQCVLSVEVVRGANTVTDEIVLRTNTASHYDDYMAGLDIKVGDLVINKYTFGEGEIVNGGSLVYKEGTVLYFVDGDVKWNGQGNGNIIIMARNKGEYPTVTATSRLLLNGTEDNVGFVCHGITFKSDYTANTTFALNDKSVLNRFYFSDCKIETVKDKPFTYFQASKEGMDATKINNILFESCRISIPQMTNTSETLNFINLRRGHFENTTMTNNVFYCGDADGAVLVNVVMNYNNEGFYKKIDVHNNTFINILGNHGGNSSGLLRVKMTADCALNNNLFWYNHEVIGKEGNGNEIISHLMLESEANDSEKIAGNAVYSAITSTQLSWQYFRKVSKWSGFNNDVELEKENPFSECTPEAGTFTYTDAFKSKGIGANFE